MYSASHVDPAMTLCLELHFGVATTFPSHPASPMVARSSYRSGVFSWKDVAVVTPRSYRCTGTILGTKPLGVTFDRDPFDRVSQYPNIATLTYMNLYDSGK